MTRRWRRRWAGTVGVAGIGLIWLGSGWFNMSVEWAGIDARGPFCREVACAGGVVAAENLVMRGPVPGSPYLHLAGPRRFGDSWKPLWEWRPMFHTDRGAFSIVIPLWVPLVILSVPTGVMWWRDRRRVAPECPKCGYDLAGIASANCPECGSAR